MLGGCAVKPAFPQCEQGRPAGRKGQTDRKQRGRVHQFSVHPPKANLDPTPEPSPALITRTGSTYSSAAVNNNNSSIYVRLTCCLMATMCLQESHASLPRCATSLPWENHRSLTPAGNEVFIICPSVCAQPDLNFLCEAEPSPHSGTITACSDSYTALHRLCFVLAMKAWTFE